MMTNRLYLVRHGVSVGNIDPQEYFIKVDHEIELTEDLGVKQMEQAATKILELGDGEPDARFTMISSPYKRTLQSKSIIKSCIDLEFAAWNGVVKEYESPLCVERAWGLLREILQDRKFYNFDPKIHFNFYYRPPEGGESFLDVYQRVIAFELWRLSNHLHNNVIIVSHGEFLKVYLMYRLGWTVEQFDKIHNPRNGEVFLIENGRLSYKTPIRSKVD